MARTRLLIGLMSGTSVDGIDAAIVRVTGTARRLQKVETLYHGASRWPAPLRRRLLAIMAPAVTTTQELCALNMLVAQHFASAALAALRAAHVRPEQVAAIGSHGQTICHLPPETPQRRPRRPRTDPSPSVGSTLQLGDPSVIALLTGMTTVGNFRPADMALGGQGAPLVPWTDAALLTSPTATRCIQNIGGIANVTYLPKRSPPSPHCPAAQHGVLAFDSGPGNMLIDALVNLATRGRQTFDRNGRLALRGRLHAPLFRRLRQHPYFDRHPPKSTGREAFGLPFARQLFAEASRRSISLPDLIHTATRLTAWSIVDAYLQFLPGLPDEVVLCGGGAENPALIAMLREELTNVSTLHGSGVPIALRRIDDFGIPNKAKEAVSFALLALAALDRVPSNLPSVTGARQPTVLGEIACPGALCS